MFCTNCGEQIEDGAAFCTKCGTPLDTAASGDAVCARCGKPIEAGAAFCTSCGAPLGIAAPYTATCPNCGNPLENGAVFCTSCGTPVGSAGAAYAPYQTETMPVVQPPAPVNPKSHKGLVIGIVVAVVVVAGAFFGISAFGGGLPWQHDSQATNQTTDEPASSQTDETSGSSAGTTTTTTTTSTSSKTSGTSGSTTSTTSGTNSTISSSNPYSAYTADYIIPDSSSRYISDSDLSGLNADQCRLARNEIYARHGRMFNDSDLQEYFSSKSWYHGTVSADSFNEDVLSELEKDNTKTIKAYEESHGYN